MVRTNWKLLALAGVVAACGTWIAACGEKTDVVVDDDDGSGGNGGTGAGGTGVPLDASDDNYFDPDGNSGDTGFDPDGNTCAWETREPERAGVDIVFVIDNSHSMNDEIQKTLDNINAFATAIANSGLDYQVIMVSAKGTNLTDFSEDVPNLKGSGLTGDMPVEVCVPAPLGVGPGGNDPCGDNAPYFHHLDHFPYGVASHNGMWLAIGNYNEFYSWEGNIPGPDGGGWSKWARYTATKYFIVITDDDAEVPTPDMGDPSIVGAATQPWEVFDRLILHDERFGPPGMFGDETNRKYVYNTICGWTFPGGLSTDPQDGGGCRTDYTDPDYNFAMSPGQQHQQLAALTGGIVESICRSDWSAVLAKLSDKVISTIGCEFMLPTPEAGVLDPNEIIVQYTPNGGAPEPLTHVTDVSKCGQYDNAWYYDDNTSPTKVILCPDACQEIGSAHTGKIDLLMGCVAPPPK